MYKSEEDYLELILRIKQRKGIVRAVDVAAGKGVSKPSVSRAVGVLKDKGYITIADDNDIQLTAAGEDKASEVYGRHTLLTNFFVLITGVPAEQAEQNACRVEHDIDRDVVAGIRRFMKTRERDGN